MKLDFYADFDDVLIKPNMSRLNSRQEVDLRADIKIEKHEDWKPIPIMSANMDTVTDANVAFELVKNNWIAVLHKYVSISDIKDLFDKIDLYNKENEKDSTVSKIDYRNVFISRGTSDADKDKLAERLLTEPRIQSVCIDVANGHRLEVVSYAKLLKDTICKDKILMVGNIVTSEAAILYAEAGVDIIKAGIGPGCFVPGSKVLTKSGLKKIETIKVGDKVLTHKNRYRTVKGITKYEEKDQVISINGIKSTLSHEYYVVNRKKPYLEEATWVQACNLDPKNHLLVFFLNQDTSEDEDYEEEPSFIDIKEKTIISYLGEVIDLEVEEDHSYNINGIIVHNSACITRVQTGVGLPQIGMVLEIKEGLSRAIENTNDLNKIKKYSSIKICVDGGMKTSGDIAKSFVAGGDFVMLGGMLAGHKESPGNEETVDGRKVKRFSGMAASISQHEGVPKYGVEEGKTVFIPYRGKLKNTIQNIEGGLRSTATYIDAYNISEFKKGKLVRTHVQENKIFN